MVTVPTGAVIVVMTAGARVPLVADTVTARRVNVVLLTVRPRSRQSASPLPQFKQCPPMLVAVAVRWFRP